ncbi:F-type H+-transporting ATPase subunit alpha [[Luteovulum] sphaeroides subsp. megalophilum]|uniref:F0F1 ATP synthase subunit alpha n=1 Tax=Cereibacter sphaeroides TaxID=1063 RepID=UPI0002A28E07|nr:F0F1 ATP synthase subunit alpha [Cereibacter sphaeroides]EKX56849.1 ATP synthase alpha chain [Rhodobacter sp. AKP1]SNT37077.1 F-type H+-transporting ATPase subunit alpha [[Luteovulum] sphaeroides subsp. megalophilum]
MSGDPGLEALKARVAEVPLGPEIEETGRIATLADGLVEVEGLPGARLGEVVRFAGGAEGLVLTLDPETVQVALLDPGAALGSGTEVRRTGQLLSVPVGQGLLGRVVDPLGRPLDGLPAILPEARLEIERPAPGIVDRDMVAEPVETGLLVVDALFAVGRGQRELIIGERATGKTSLAVDAIVNQAASDIVCFYVAIGQRTTAVRRVIETVREKGAFARTVFVVAPATASPGLRWIAPFAATSMAEWVRDRGGHALIVYDDLTKHAAVHRELALLARQPPGREAYPGDIFYLHARLLERSAKLSAVNGGGSLTALPIAEIEAGNLSAYIPTNLISIADGQIVTSAALFAANQRPAVDIGLSVSRVGGKAQRGALKAVAGRVRLDYAQYLEMKMFSRFGGFGDAALRARLARGERIGALLAQPRTSPLSTPVQVALLAALAEGALDDVPLEDLARLKAALGPVLAADASLGSFRAAPDRLEPETRAALLACVRRAREAP